MFTQTFKGRINFKIFWLFIAMPWESILLLYNMKKAFGIFLIILISMHMPCFAAGNGAVDKAKEAYDRGTAQYKNFNVQRDIVYKKVDGLELSLDLVLPEKRYKKGAPLVMFIHGGGWHSGDRYHLGDDIGYYTQRGVACATISYRLTTGPVKSTVRDCIIDSKDAARFLVKNAKKFGLDASRMAVYGHSAGGHLALMEALAPNAVFEGDKSLKGENPQFVCAVGLAPIVTFVNPKAKDLTANEKGMERILGGNPAENRKEAEDISPITYLSANSVPVMVIQGDDDTLVDVESARIFYDKAKKLGAKVQYIEIANAWHSFKSRDKSKTPSMSGAEIKKARRDFIDKYLFDGIEPL